MSKPFYHCEREEWDEWCKEDVHGWFGLTYASYLTLPRSILQAMPAAWQHEFVRLLDQLSAEYTAPIDTHTRYAVLLRDGRGRFRGHDPLRHYRYPDRGAIERSHSLSHEAYGD
jgi:hypothetical protein